MTSPKRFHKVIIALATLGITGALAAATLFLTDVWRPSSVPQTQQISTIPIVPQEYFAEHPIMLNITKNRDSTLTVAQPGTVTESVCDAQTATISSGTVPLQVDGAPLLALHTETPLWRDLNYRDTGPDVDALKAELQRLGYETSPGNQYLWLEAQALSLLATGTPVTPDTSTMVVERMIWLPSTEVTVSNCTLMVGDPVETPRATFAKSHTPPTVTLGLKPDETLTDRVLDVQGELLPLAENGTQLSEESLGVLFASETYANALRSPETGDTFQIPAISRLITPLTSALVPPAALTMESETSDASSACVTENGTVLPVRVASSRLGQTVIVFDPAQPLPLTIDATGPKTCTSP